MSGRNYYAALTTLERAADPDSSGASAAQPAASPAERVSQAGGASVREILSCGLGAISLNHGQEGGAAATTSGATTSGATSPGADPTDTPEAKLHLPLIWLDLEMTGLDLEKDTIVEVACIITDGEMRTTIEGPAIAIHHSDSVLANMNEWCIEHHAASGLTQRVRDSNISMAEAEQQVLRFVQQHTEPKLAQLAGNSVHVDLAFLRRHMPLLADHMPHRIVDVSTVVELARRWFPKAYRWAPRKKAAHTALSDIQESIKELRYYREAVFRPCKPCKPTK